MKTPEEWAAELVTVEPERVGFDWHVLCLGWRFVGDFPAEPNATNVAIRVRDRMADAIRRAIAEDRTGGLPDLLLTQNLEEFRRTIASQSAANANLAPLSDFLAYIDALERYIRVMRESPEGEMRAIGAAEGWKACRAACSLAAHDDYRETVNNVLADGPHAHAVTKVPEEPTT